MKKSFILFLSLIVAVVPDAFGAVKKTSKQSAIQSGTSVRSKTQAKGLYDQECYDLYYGCMDQFCISDNENGGSCACSDLSIEYEKQFSEIQSIFAEAERIASEEVEKVKLGAQADIVFTGKREYDEDGNLVDVDNIGKNDKKSARADLLSLWDEETDDEVFEDGTDFSDLVGDALYRSAEELCLEQIPESCEGDLALIQKMYTRQITSDCKAFENSIAKKKKEADNALVSANSEVRKALKESFEESNKFDLGQCMIEFKKCMLTQDACGENWENCVSIVASENMQNNETVSTAGTKVESVETFDITASTMDVLNSKRMICENVLGKCMAVRDMVWPAFLKEAAPTIRLAESQAESKFRQSCLTTISNCIHTACKDDIAGKGVDTMDACLSRPDMARSFCKVEIDPCERMEPLIWGYVVDKLAAMRVDACTQEVKDCFTADTRCGENFQNCIGMDYDYIHDICPIDSLVVCKANNPDFKMDDLDSMLMGLYLNIDNAALDQCQELVDKKMTEVCGSTTDCNRFAADDTIGGGSVRTQKDGAKYRVTGMISFGSIKMGDASGKTKDEGADDVNVLGPGEIGVQEYLAQIRERNTDVPNADAIIATIEEELNNIAGTINRTIEMIEQDPEIQFCVNGRDLSQITGDKGAKTEARFPNLLNQVKMQIAVSALRKAQDNYNKKYNEAVAEAMRDAEVDIAQYMCQMLPANNGAGFGGPSTTDVELSEPFAISYDVSSGLKTKDLAKGGRGSSATSGKGGLSVGGRIKMAISGGTREMWSTFNRETRICHLCSSTVTKNCTSTYKNGFLGIIGSKTENKCTESAPVEKCEDIPM